MSLASFPLSVSGFTLLPLTYSPTSHHILYIRLHVGPAKKSSDKGKQTWPQGRTLFIVNVPPSATEREIILLFQSSCGMIERIVFDSDRSAEPDEEQEASESEDEAEAADEENEEGESSNDEYSRKKRRLAKNAKKEPRPPKVAPLHPSPVHLRILRRTGRNAHIVFTDASSIDRALVLSKPSKGQKAPQSRPWPTSDDAPHGLAHYTALYDTLRPPLDAVQQHADTFMELYDYNEAERKRALQKDAKYRKGEALVDEDGFTLVTRGGAYGQAVGGGVGVASKKWQTVQTEGKDGVAGGGGGGGKRKRKEKQEKNGFYAFQQHEKKRKELMDLKKRWEEDKAKVEKLKSSRQFRPY